MINDLVLAFLFFLPAGMANMAPVFANKVPLLNRWKTPMDFGKSHKGARIFGDNKTWRGVVFGVFVATLTIWLERKVWASFYPSRSILWFELGRLMHFNTDYLPIGALLGLGALIGDAVESYFKRRRGIISGKSWFPFDQTDYIIGGLLLASPLVYLTLKGDIIVISLWGCLHLVVSYVGFQLGLKNKVA